MTDNGLRVQLLTEDSVQRLAQIDVEWNPRPWSEQAFREELRNPTHRSLGAFIDERVVGYVMAHQILDEAHITTFGVASDWQRRGVGRALLEAFLGALKARGVVVVTLEVRKGNVIAQSLYTGMGFRAAGVRPAFYHNNGEDALTMRLDMP
jgi:ribosomal-protein-alanine N-acetyltransferase